MPTTVYVGLALTAHNNGQVAAASFDHVTITGTTGPLPPAVLRLTDGGFYEAGAAFSTNRVGITNFDTNFTFRLHDGTTPQADGITFVIQGSSPSALGFNGGGLGWDRWPSSGHRGARAGGRWWGVRFWAPAPTRPRSGWRWPGCCWSAMGC